ncbi:MAG: hypothetical protein ACQJCO_08945 [cyanobacterium endosymbiont of Rhopalodia sterrenbergii]
MYSKIGRSLNYAQPRGFSNSCCVLATLRSSYFWQLDLMLPNQPIISYQQATKLLIEIYIQPPTKFVVDNYSKLLPECKFYPQTIIIILLEAKIYLEKTNQQVRQEKQRFKK